MEVLKEDMKLPPIEPSTPNVVRARKIMTQGDELVRNAISEAGDHGGSVSLSEELESTDLDGGASESI